MSPGAEITASKNAFTRGVLSSSFRVSASRGTGKRRGSLLPPVSTDNLISQPNSENSPDIISQAPGEIPLLKLKHRSLFSERHKEKCLGEEFNREESHNSEKSKSISEAILEPPIKISPNEETKSQQTSHPTSKELPKDNKSSLFKINSTSQEEYSPTPQSSVQNRMTMTVMNPIVNLEKGLRLQISDTENIKSEDTPKDDQQTPESHEFALNTVQTNKCIPQIISDYGPKSAGNMIRRVFFTRKLSTKRKKSESPTQEGLQAVMELRQNDSDKIVRIQLNTILGPYSPKREPLEKLPKGSRTPPGNHSPDKSTFGNYARQYQKNSEFSDYFKVRKDEFRTKKELAPLKLLSVTVDDQDSNTDKSGGKKRSPLKLNLIKVSSGFREDLMSHYHSVDLYLIYVL